MELGAVGHAYDSSLVRRLRQKDRKLEASLGNLERPCLKI